MPPLIGVVLVLSRENNRGKGWNPTTVLYAGEMIEMIEKAKRLLSDKMVNDQIASQKGCLLWQIVQHRACS